ncbi:hypothetical protein CNG01670 [Cryptococcus deneoformans JEC21]|uniref:Uncharacterized protein n=1 Tax=Cryptococcus deneoformans (strain JEC21 / ATCC MYA-565) TaxID=214684 RepID=Q5KE56_CRYD1|nr:hypothetical protein CNG01670 [Cryptococcus neoformans var. neoformans JEC21]AAW44581.1 hypothetical protein CNG01670 [Cryptococcus neoformans var. neoformans JEC21]
MDGQAPSPVIHTPSQRPYPYHPNAGYPYTQQQPYPSPLPTHPARQLHTPLPYNPSQRPVHPLPNGHSPTFPMTPPYAPYLNGPIQTSPPSSSGSEALPSNQIHIVQTTPLPVMLRSSSTLSTTSTNRPPPLSNGPSPAVEEVIVDMSDQYEMYPPQQAQMRQVGPRTGLDQVQARSVVNATRPNEMDGVPRQMVMPQQIPISNPLSSATVVGTSDSNLWQRPLEDGTGLRVVANFLEGLGAMQSKNLEGWLSFVMSHFENNSRFQFVLIGEKFQMFDVPITYLPRFFLSLPSPPSIILTDPIESLPSTEETMVLCPDMEWRCDSKAWKGALNMVVGKRGKIEKMDIVLGNRDEGGEIFSEGALRVLKMAQEMESFALVMRLAQQENLPPREALQQFIQEE